MNPHNVHESLKRVVDELWSEAMHDFQKSGEPEKHIFKDLQVLEEHLSDDSLKAIVFRGLFSEFNSIRDAEEYAADETRESLDPHTIVMVNSNTLTYALTAEFQGVKIGSTESYRLHHRKD